MSLPSIRRVEVIDRSGEVTYTYTWLDMKIRHRILSWLKRDIKWHSYLVALLVFLISVIVFSVYGFEGTLVRDDAIILYGGQQLAEGVPPYLSIFDNKTPLAPLLSGVGVSVASLLDLDDILAVRITFLVFCSLAPVGLYLLGSALFNSQRVGLLTAFTFVGYSGFGIHAASGPREKALMITFVVFSLLFIARRKWFWAGVLSSIAFLTWQPAAIYALIVIFLALVQSETGRARVRNTILAVSGILAPVVIVSLYFWSQGAFQDFFDGAILFNLFYLERLPQSLWNHIIRPIEVVIKNYRSTAFSILIGFLMVLVIYVWRLRLYKSSLLKLIRKDNFSALLLTFPLIVIWSLLDFQRYPDFFVFLPYVAIGFGWLLYIAYDSLLKIKVNGPVTQKLIFITLCAVLLGSAATQYYTMERDELLQQRRWAERIESQLAPGDKIVSIGIPQALVLLHRTNPSRYITFSAGFDNWIEAKTPGGFEGWLEELEEYDPSVILLAQPKGRFAPLPAHMPLTIDWLRSRYQEVRIGDWRLYVKDNP